MQEARMTDPSGEYRLFQKIGRGGMGQVFAGVRVARGDLLVPCVIKVLHPELADTPKDRERFREEARIAAQLDHGRIVKVIDSGEMQGCPFLVMERVDGVSLRELTRRIHEAGMPRLDVDLSLFIVGEILAALQYAHHRTIGGKDAGVIHYDVTPGNILVSSSGEIKLTDFGIARFAATSEGTMSRSVGTPRYMSPEQILGHARRETDIYSLGVVLHELLDGTRYLADLPMDQFRARVISGPPAELQRRDIPPWLDRLRRQMLSPHPEERPAASDARTVLLENCTRYHLASQTLIKLYSTVIGQQRSGLTEHLLSLREEIQIFRETSGPLHRVAAPVEEPSPRKPTAIEVEPTAIDDAVPQIRRKDARRHTPSDPSEQGSTRSHTSTLGTIVEQVEPTERLSTEEVMRLAAMRMVQLEAVEAVEPVEQTQDVPAPFVEEPAPIVAAVATDPSPVVLSPVVPSPAAAPAPALEITPNPTTPDVPAVVIAPTRTPARRGSLPALVAGMGLLILALVACVIWLATRQQPTNASPETTEPTTPPTSPAPSTAEVAAVDTKAVVPEPEPEPTVEAPKPAALPPPEPEPVPVPIEPAPEPEAPVAEPPETKPDTKPVAPKPAPVTRVEVTFLIDNVDQAEIKIGSKTLAFNYAALTKLKPGKYPIQYRKKGETKWREPGTLTVDALPPGQYYEVKLGAKVTATARKEGSK
jgi:serine/threonine protein kinase